jgi:hypothetical protein
MDKFNRVVKVPDEERLRNMTTLCLSVLCARAGGLKNVSEQLRIQYELLMRLQDLCDGNGDGRLEGFSREALEADSGPMISGEQRQWAKWKTAGPLRGGAPFSLRRMPRSPCIGTW